MEFKTSAEMKDLLSQAAALNGLDLTSFVLGPAIDKARQVLSEHATIVLNQKGQLALVDLLQSNPAPTSAMRDLMALEDLPLQKVPRTHGG